MKDGYIAIVSYVLPMLDIFSWAKSHTATDEKLTYIPVGNLSYRTWTSYKSPY